MLFERQEQSPLGAARFGATKLSAGAPSSAEQFFFEPLIDPSLQMNSAPLHRATPPFPPEQG
jgi:hypothetical protein